MTTIATDGKSMAGDGQSNHAGSIMSSNSVKVIRLDDGRILGAAGDVSFRYEFIEWLLSDGESEKPEIKGDSSFSALLLNPDGSVDLSGHECVLLPVRKLPFAIGSGMDFAIGAMDAGASPEMAVAIAMQRDPHTGGEITVLERPTTLEAVA